MSTFPPSRPRLARGNPNAGTRNSEVTPLKSSAPLSLVPLVFSPIYPILNLGTQGGWSRLERIWLSTPPSFNTEGGLRRSVLYTTINSDGQVLICLPARRCRLSC